MALKDLSPRNLFLFFVGMAITMLFIKAMFLLPAGAYGRALMLSAESALGWHLLSSGVGWSYSQ